MRAGNDLTIVTYGTMVHVSEAAAAASGSTRRSSTCDRWCRSTPIRSATRSSGPAAASSCTRRRALRASAPSSRRRSRKVLLESRGADPAGRGLGHALSARVRVGIFPGPGARRKGLEGRHGGCMSRYVFKMPDLGEGTVTAEVVEWKVKVGDTVNGRPDHRRGDDRQGGRRDSGAGQRPRRLDHGRAGRHGRRGRRADCFRNFRATPTDGGSPHRLPPAGADAPAAPAAAPAAAKR